MLASTASKQQAVAVAVASSDVCVCVSRLTENPLQRYLVGK